MFQMESKAATQVNRVLCDEEEKRNPKNQGNRAEKKISAHGVSPEDVSTVGATKLRRQGWKQYENVETQEKWKYGADGILKLGNLGNPADREAFGASHICSRDENSMLLFPTADIPAI